MPDATARQGLDAMERAALAWRMAPYLCPHSQPPFFDCTSYHRVRPLLRLLGLTAQPSDHEEFFRKQIARAVAATGPRVLISGASDEGMIEMVLAALEGSTPHLTLVDRCASPVLVNEHFALKHRLALECAVADVAAFHSSKPFDVIVTHSFIAQIAPARRPAIFRSWHDLLRLSGRVITNVRINPSPEHELHRFAPDAAERLGREAQRRFDAMNPAFPASSEDVMHETTRHAGQRHSWPLRSLDELTDALEAAGFAIEQAETHRSKSRVPDISGPAVPSGAEHVQIVAVRL